MTFNMKFSISEVEKNTILEMHSKLKKPILNEQYDVRAELQKLIDTGCIRDGIIIKMESSEVTRTYAIKKESKKEPGTFYYFFVDKKVAKKTPSSPDAEFLTDTEWKCF